MGFSLERIELLLLVAAMVAMLTRRLRIPYSIGLVMTGAVLAMLPFSIDVQMTKEVVFNFLLPPLIFEAALFLPWADLRRDFGVVIAMASIGLVLAAGITAAGMHLLAGWPLISAGIFGVLIAATDPVSVIATFKEAGVTGRLRLLVEAESLLNDGTAAVMFGILMTVAGGSAVTGPGVLLDILTTVGGGVGVGFIIGWIILYLAGHTEDPLVELTFTTVAAYGAFMVAEHWHFSGVLATLTAGLILGNRGHLGAISEKGQEAVEAFWEFAAFIANSLIFLLIGIREAQQVFIHLWPAILIAIALVTLGRAVAIYPVCYAFKETRLEVARPHQHILFWGGLRGALALALALGLPVELPYRDQIITVSFAVVAFSVIVQGLTVTPLMRRLGQMQAK
ncbi:MAG TPA: sodium:proton antiporter [Rhizomicrobium sp.]